MINLLESWRAVRLYVAHDCRHDHTDPGAVEAIGASVSGDGQRAKKAFALARCRAWMYGRELEHGVFIRRSSPASPKSPRLTWQSLKAGWNYGETRHDLGYRLRDLRSA